MSKCDELGDLLHQYADGEIDELAKWHVEAHLAACEPCHDELEQLYHLRLILGSADVRYDAPRALRRTVERSIGARRRSISARVLGWLVPAGAGAVAASLVPFFAPMSFSQVPLEQELVESHVRSLQANHLLDVATSSEYSIAPWFSGQLDFAPRAPDVADQGFRLLGCRIDYANGRALAAIVYERRHHKVNLFVWPASTKPDKLVSRQGYSILEWSYAELRYAAISDASPVDLLALRSAFDKRDSPTRV